MTTEQCTSKHTYTITGPGGETLATTTGGPKLAWVHWNNAGPRALDVTATHSDGAVCLPATREVHALLPHGPYETRRDARVGGLPLIAVQEIANPDDDPITDEIREAQHQAAADYITGLLTHLGVELGAFDQRIAAWISGWEPEVVAVVLGWAVRARAAGRDAAISAKA